MNRVNLAIVIFAAITASIIVANGQSSAPSTSSSATSGKAASSPTSQKASSPNDKIMAELMAVIEANIKATNDEDVDAVIETLHPESPAINSTKKVMEALFKSYDLESKISNATYFGGDGEFQAVRLTQTTIKISGKAEYTDNTIDVVHFLKKDGDKWKLWTSAPLKVTPLDEIDK